MGRNENMIFTHFFFYFPQFKFYQFKKKQTVKIISQFYTWFNKSDTKVNNTVKNSMTYLIFTTTQLCKIKSSNEANNLLTHVLAHMHTMFTLWCSGHCNLTTDLENYASSFCKCPQDTFQQHPQLGLVWCAHAASSPASSACPHWEWHYWRQPLPSLPGVHTHLTQPWTREETDRLQSKLEVTETGGSCSAK